MSASEIVGGVAVSIDGRTSIVGGSVVKADSTPKRRSKRARRDVETMEYLAAARRFIRAAGRRVADSDEPELVELLALSQVVQDAVAEAVAGQRAHGRSWAQIALGTGTTREAAWQRWGRG